MELKNSKNNYLIIIGLISLLALSSCGLIPGDGAFEPTATQTIAPASTSTTQPTPTLAPTSTITTQSTQSPTLEEAAAQVIQALAEKDLETVAAFVHPELGVRFSPYAYVREEHQVFMPDELAALSGSEETYLWGQYDGSGEPIELTFDDYYEEFIYSADFANPEEMAVNERLGQGNTINNIPDFYPDSSFVEYHFSGFEEQYEGMDWESLRLVFTQEEGTWYLVGIVHDEWTI